MEKADSILRRLKEHGKSVHKAVSRVRTQQDLFTDAILHQRAKLLEKAKWLLFNHPALFRDEQLASFVWKYAFYNIVSVWRGLTRRQRNEQAHEGQTQAAHSASLDPQLGSFLLQAIGWFDAVLVGLSSMIAFPLDEPERAPPILPTSRPDPIPLAAITIAHTIHVCLGDLHRYAYQELLPPPPSSPSPSPSPSCEYHRRASATSYRRARRLSPSSAHPWSQLAMLVPTQHHNHQHAAGMRGRAMKLYCLARSCTTTPPHTPAAVDALSALVKTLPTIGDLQSYHHTMPPVELSFAHLLAVTRMILDQDSFPGEREFHGVGAFFHQSLLQLMSSSFAFNSFRPRPDSDCDDRIVYTEDVFELCFAAVFCSHSSRHVPTKDTAAVIFALTTFVQVLTFTQRLIHSSPAIDETASRLLGVARLACVWMEADTMTNWTAQNSEHPLLQQLWTCVGLLVNTCADKIASPSSSSSSPLSRELHDIKRACVLVDEDVELIGCTALHHRHAPGLHQHHRHALGLFVFPSTSPLAFLIAEDDGIHFITREEAERRARQRKNNLLFRLSSQHQQHQLAEMQTQVKRLQATSSLVVVTDADSFASHPYKVKKLVTGRQFIVAVPVVTLDGLDALKSGEERINKGARTANHLLGKWLEEGSSVVEVQGRDTDAPARARGDDDDSGGNDGSNEDHGRLLSFAAAVAAERNHAHDSVTIITSDQRLANTARERGFNAQPLVEFTSAVSKQNEPGTTT
ncbi:hypothetical protein PTSG_12557 [Salpingoeca rosetta]|uniref:PIN domain-containing protein n=1 Tax=Salpingoeca rosetta (strain ATCC 50818 / BSB-021) TaxID=946362 RepID=F2UEE5_SALR5|nr:uncharacterized protein PTSG_12557 [Salpingoeca rosetta]XP_012493090.1 hypothetical protein, variant [Salpingoeca rosetta]EGD74995.1 hypothetical protein, variant [Salpingoeca rosetta]EGD74996.1 hypothetical protein PTSG_12557 [Salpingoeca rosetta]|eukprot:XP_004992640.1 hypothetical protein PTSG_12557 [Salpingoeca rosetta]